MKLGFASDHRGFKLKKELMDYFNNNGYIVIDYGTDSEESCDYPDYAYKLGNGILSSEVDFGVAICGTGIGISIALNKMKGIKCAKVSDPWEAHATRNDNDTRIIAFGERMDFDNAVLSIKTFIDTPFSDLEKHNRRNNKVNQIENGEYRG